MPRSIFRLLTHSLNRLSLGACDLFRLLALVSRSRLSLAAENLFLRKQLALFQERKEKPRPMIPRGKEAEIVLWRHNRAQETGC